MFPKRGAVALVATALALILLISFKTPDQVGPTSDATSDASTDTETIAGSVIATRFGPVAVEITVTNGTMTHIQATELPTGGRSGEISDYAAPILASEALRAQSAEIDIVSGATYTSEAYARSLQSALDQAGIASTEVAA